ncbi:hypothetical protein CHL67_09590 [Prosthecochloris sp. GSB1]|uniref:hypothetical protein n=1 Tax=Prosthecochloris sp. GSB1 TaxID=281093 RepID=UPI000B8C9BB8|nr:hypothetical protein [Prosthecochloris sp. GSB1]ASQ91135.1 hypothetical protein CHL67_09590 [Prosthecochloris sp. GSB1]
MPQEKKQHPDPGSRDRSFTDRINDTVTSSYDDLLAIIEARAELIKIEITEKIAVAASAVIIALVLFAGMVYLVSTVALFIGELLGHYYLGYLAVSAFFLLTVLFFVRIQPDLLKNIIHKLLLSSHGKKS